MKKSNKFLFILSLIFIGFGTVAILWGNSHDGLKDIKEATAAKKVEQELSSFKHLELKLNTRDLIIEPSKDDKWHLTYYTDRKVLGELTVKQDDDKLSLNQADETTTVTGLLSALGYYLNNQDIDSHDVVLSVPKNAKFDSIKGYVSGSTHLYNFPIEEVDLTSESIYTDDTVISKANFSANSLYLDNSNISQLKLDASDYLSLTNSTIKEAQLDGESTILEVDKSHLQNTSITIANGAFTLTDTELDNVNLSGDSNAITAKQLALKNLIEITSDYSDITIHLEEKTRSTTNFNLKVTNEELKVSDAITGSDQITADENQENHSFNKQVKDNNATLTINSKEGPISIN
ncbi:DUF4097 family beta strand repeat-containing protein [Streptococcus hyovaginalis]|uniref:DUF4097 family beta strand repeat-containing protein n=1 Tax=Streptococcus hyovaginalis TaxID=149015 RepID=UPI00040D0F9D|nr:DUF4097 family beta strand repeat-containing protein [Streptococcus hyovaginalis]